MTLQDILGRDVSRETTARLEAYADLLKAENKRQNLVSRTTIPDLWERHILDCAQLVPLGAGGASWADLGSGAGLPGIVLAILQDGPVTLIEPRRLRVEFLQRVARELDLANVAVAQAKAQSASGQFDLITARAVAPAVDLVGISRHLTHKDSKYLLMKGRSAQSELEALQRAWQGSFALVPSRTDTQAAILVAGDMRRRGRG
jgi:16S rRNA (guanine527-N7)-methyltransferase